MSNESYLKNYGYGRTAGTVGTVVPPPFPLLRLPSIQPSIAPPSMEQLDVLALMEKAYPNYY